MFKNISHNTFIGVELVYLPTCHSTNDEAAKILKQDTKSNGLVVITSNQTKGKGQRGNVWLSQSNQNLTFSILLNIDFLKAHNLFVLNICVSLGINKYLNNLKSLENLDTNSNFKIKWPNDIYYANQKLGGILIENIFKGDGSIWSIVGIGLNVNQNDFKYLNATSLSKISGKKFDLQNILENITQNIEQYLNEFKIESTENLKTAYLVNLYRYNEMRHYKSNNIEFEGKIINIDNQGRLMLEIEGEIKYFDKQEIGFL